MSVRKNISKQLKSLRKTLKKQGKYLTKAYKINNIIDDLKEADKLSWTERWNNNGEYVDDAGRPQREQGVGLRFQNLSSYLRRKKSEESHAQYRQRANRVLEERERDARWRVIADRAHNRVAQQRRMQTRRYEQGIEIRLATMGLTPAQIEANPNPVEREQLYRRRLLEAPTVRMALLAEADRAHEEMMERIRSRPALSPRREDYDSDEGWGKKKKRKSKTKKSRRKHTSRTKKNKK